jgi:predicted dehydrogenase
MTQLGVGIIGMGVGERHIEGFRRHPAARIVALCDINPDVRARIRQAYPDVEVLDDAAALIDDDRIKIVSIASYDDSHYDEVIRSLHLDKHVFVEKPLCLRVEEFRDIRARLALRPHLRLSSNLVLRHSPRFMDLRDRIAQGQFGRLFNVESEYAYGRLDKLTQGWRGRIPDYSVILGGAIHLIDLILWLTRERVVEVIAMGNGIASADSDFHGHDMVSALLRFESGLVGKISANFGCVFPHFHRLLVYGTQATFENGRDAAFMWRSRDPDVAPELVTSAYPGVDKGDLIPNFVDAILGRDSAIVTESDVLATMAVGLAIDRSIIEGRAVKVAEI